MDRIRDPWRTHLDWLSSRQEVMEQQLLRYVEVVSGSYEPAAVSEVVRRVRADAEALGAVIEEISLPPILSVGSDGELVERRVGPALRLRKRPQAPLQVFLSIHLDVVYGSDNPPPPLRHFSGPNGRSLQGPGVADAKGGAVVLLNALQAFEQAIESLPTELDGLGWEVLFNPDEEIGSLTSLPLLQEAGGRCHLGLVFEPSLADGQLVGSRKGSGNFVLVVHGLQAHAGRDPEKGRNAISALARFVVALDKFAATEKAITFNAGKIEGGGPVNVVPDFALLRFNLRVETREQQQQAESFLREEVERIMATEGYKAELHGAFHSPPKPLEGLAEQLYGHMRDCGAELGLNISWKSSAGFGA